MDKEARCAVAGKLILDAVLCVLVLISFSVCSMVYMKDYHFSWNSVTFSFDVYGLPAYSELSFSDFEARKCGNSTAVQQVICEQVNRLEVAGITYLVMCCAAGLLTLYNILNIFGLACYFNCCGLLRVREVHYIVWLIYGLGVGLYVLIARVFNLPAPDNTPPYPREYDSGADVGILVMVAAFLVSTAGGIYFITVRNDVTRLEAAINPAYKLLVQRHLAAEPKA